MSKNLPIGRQFANVLYSEIDEKLSLSTDNSIRPTLAIVQVGDDDASNIYVKYKRLACKKLGFGFHHFRFPDSISNDELIQRVSNINKDPLITGCIVQLPLPDHINKYGILNAVDPNKDVDGFNFTNIGKLYLGTEHISYAPATAYGIYLFLKHHNVETKGKCCVIIGKSTIVGKPLQLLLSDEDDSAMTTILCDKYTENLHKYTKMADVLIVAANKHHLIDDADKVKEGAVVIDVGIHRIGRKVEGDVNYDVVKDKCSLITPVPGGVGPITVACLMYNLAKPFFKTEN